VSTPSKANTLTSKCNCILTTLEELNKLLWPFSTTAEVLAMTASLPKSFLLFLPDTDANVEMEELRPTTLMEQNNATKEPITPMLLTAADPTAKCQFAAMLLPTTRTERSATLEQKTSLPDNLADLAADFHIVVMVLSMLERNATRVSGGRVPDALGPANLNAETNAFNQESNATTVLLELARSM